MEFHQWVLGGKGDFPRNRNGCEATAGQANAETQRDRGDESRNNRSRSISKKSGDAEFLRKKPLEPLHGGIQLIMEFGSLRALRQSQGICRAVGKRSCRIALAESGDEVVHPRYLSARVEDLFQGVRLGDGTRLHSKNLAAVKEPATRWPILVDGAGAGAALLAVSGAGLEEEFDPLLAPELQSEGGKLARVLSSLQLDGVEEDAVTAHAAGAAETSRSVR